MASVCNPPVLFLGYSLINLLCPIVIVLQIGGTFLGVSEGLPDDFPQPTIPPEPADGLSGGEIAAIVVPLTTVAIIAVVVGITVVYYIRRRRHKFVIQTAMSPNDYYVYRSDQGMGSQTVMMPTERTGESAEGSEGSISGDEDTEV